MSPSFRGAVDSNTYQTPPVPEKFDKVYKASHYSEPDKVYQVNLFNKTCTCPDFSSRANKFSKDDVRAVCKHIVDKLKYAKLYQTYGSLTANLLHCSAYLGDDIFLQCEVTGARYVLSTSLRSNWVNVHVASSSKPGKAVVLFGFDVATKTWQYEEPKNARQIEDFIHSLI